jgi:hypothetical protein
VILHSEELNDLHGSADVVRIMKCKRIRWVGHVAITKGKGNS